MGIITVGTNSWVTLAEANTYFETRYNASGWASISDVNKISLLITACNWIRSQSEFSIALTVTADIIKQGQYETAWYIYNWYDDHEKRRALKSQGVKDFTISRFSESLEASDFPFFLKKYFFDYVANLGGVFATVERELDD